MLNKIKITIVFLGLLSTTFFAQWNNEGAWPSESFVGGTHGITVDPDGKIWTSTYYKHDTWITPVDSISIATSAIYVINPDGTPAEFSPIYFVETSNGTVIDTLNGNCRGLTTDENGNILYVQSGPNKLFKIDYKTGKGIGRRVLGDELGSSPTKPSVSDDGTIFIGPVVGNESSAAAITMYTADLELLGRAVVGPPGVGRTMEISKDGNTLYWMPFDLQQMYVYTRESVLSDFVLSDSLLKGMSIESSAWNPETGNLWVSNDARGLAHHTHLTWFAVNVTTKALVDSFTWQPNDNEGELARAIGFSPDGIIAYAGTFEVSTVKIQKFTYLVLDIEKNTDKIPEQFELKQNYPNPFNPTTTISFEMPKDGMVRLEIYDILGREVESLINEYKQAGSYKITFDATELTSGTYIYTVRAGKYQESKKMTILK